MPRDGRGAVTAPGSGVAANGIGLMLLACLGIAIHDALVKSYGHDLGLWQLVIGRSLVAAAGILLAALALGRLRHLRARRPAWLLLRTLSQALAMLFYLVSLAELPFAIASALFYTSPISMLLLSRLFFDERITRLQILAVAISFCGVVLAIQPQDDDFSWFELLPCLAGTCYAFAVVLNSKRLQAESPLAITFYLTLSATAVALAATLAIEASGLAGDLERDLPYLATRWRPLGLGPLALVALLAGLYVLVMTSYARAFQLLPVPVSGALDYVYIVFAVLIGLLAFAERPKSGEFAGIALILAGGLLAVVPPRRRPLRGAAPAGEALARPAASDPGGSGP